MKMPEQLHKPARILFIAVSGVLLLVFCAVLFSHWHTMTARSRWVGVMLAGSFVLLGQSLLSDDDEASRLIYAMCAFITTLLAVQHGLFGP